MIGLVLLLVLICKVTCPLSRIDYFIHQHAPSQAVVSNGKPENTADKVTMTEFQEDAKKPNFSANSIANSGLAQQPECNNCGCTFESAITAGLDELIFESHRPSHLQNNLTQPDQKHQPELRLVEKGTQTKVVNCACKTKSKPTFKTYIPPFF